MEALFRYLQDQIYGVCPDAQAVIEAFYDLRNAYDKLPTNPTFKFAIGQEVWFLKNDRVQKASVRVHQITESVKRLDSEDDYFSHCTEKKSVTIYSFDKTNFVDSNWRIEESDLFATKQKLLESL